MKVRQEGRTVVIIYSPVSITFMWVKEEVQRACSRCERKEGGAAMLAKTTRLLIAEESGATAVEYAIMVALIAAVIIVTVTALGTQLNTLFRSVVTALGGA